MTRSSERMRNQLRRASERAKALPPHARPTVTHPTPEWEPVNVTPGLAWDDRQLEVLRAAVARAYRAELEVEHLRRKDETAEHQDRQVESWKDERIRHLEGRIRHLEDYVLHLRGRVHSAVDDLQRRYADDMRELADHRSMAVTARREIDKYRTKDVPAWQYGSAMNMGVVKALLAEIEAEKAKNPVEHRCPGGCNHDQYLDEEGDR